jgi:hypothetical protein
LFYKPCNLYCTIVSELRSLTLAEELR